MQIVEKDGKKMVVLGGALLQVEDHEQVTLRSQRTGQGFAEALADYVRDLREYVKKGERIILYDCKLGEDSGDRKPN